MKLVYPVILIAFAIIFMSATKKPNQSRPSISPIEASQITKQGSNFGMRAHPFYKTIKMHTGMDFIAPYDTPVMATGSGKVTKIINQEKGYGNQITITHSKNIKTTYSHLHEINVELGQKVLREQVIGTLGNSGASTAPHLHYEVLVDGKPVNPTPYITP